MTRQELKIISQERRYISKKLHILDPDNPIENQQREQLFLRLVFLEHKIDRALLSIKQNKLRIITL